MTQPRLLLLILLLLPLAVGARTRDSFNDGWRFHKGEAPGAEAAGFDHSAWRPLRLPHDWAIEGPFDIKYNARCGGLPFHGTGWYCKEFSVPATARGKRVMLEFDGAMYNAHVWINGHFLGNRPFGYIGFQYDLTPHLNFGGCNTIAVRLQPEDLSSRWYPGAGLYRNTWLETKAATHVAHWGTFVTTPSIDDQSAEVRVATRIRHTGPEPTSLTLETTLLDPDGTEVAEESSPLVVVADGTISVTHVLEVANPRRWDLQTPQLYTAVTRILDGRTEIDRYETPFGIRSVEYVAGKGCFLNGRLVRLNGVCMHHDLGPLGAAVNRRATERQLEIMKAMGVNAIRTSHNPPSPEQLALCDKLGLLVQVEAFDCWRMPKVPNGYNKFFDAWHERDLRDMIRRDRNHPSVIMWSIGNEILEQGRKDGWKLARHLHRICKDEDPTRLTSAGFNNYTGSVNNGLAAEVDVPGFNYQPLSYREVSTQHPDWHILGSETSSCVSSRGVYHLPIQKYNKHESLQVTSYDLIGPPWAYPPDIEFRFQAENPNVIGEFVWTGFDYLGEPTPFGGRDNSTNGYWNADWPARSSYFGTVDLCGFPKDRYYLYQSQWTGLDENPMVHLLPHWNWEGREDEPIPVYAYTNATEVELFLNGKSLGRRKKGTDTTPLKVSFKNWKEGDYQTPYRLRWDVPYAPGELKAVAIHKGKPVATTFRHTAGPPAGLTLTADRAAIAAGGQDLSFVTVRVVDAAGHPCPVADHLIRFKIDGPGEIAAVGNGNPATIESFQAAQRKAFSGMALVILRGANDATGPVQLNAEADGLQAATATIQIQ